MKDIIAQTEADVEALVDRVGMKAFLCILASVCAGKAQHVQENWQDEALSREWMRLYRRIDKTSDTVSVNL